jgi:hypothetical protein
MEENKKRKWKEVNEKYVKRGEFFINPEFLDSWINEINKMNSGKVGEPYLYPNSIIEFTAYFHCKGFDYRGCEGILRGLSKLLQQPFPVISYTQICRRTNQLQINFKKTEEKVVVGVDGSGEKVSNRGEWMRQKWKVRRGWIKVVIMGTKDGVMDLRVGSESLNERKAGRGMIRKNRKQIKKAIMDGLHDCRDTFNLCEKYGIETAIKIRKGASTKARNSPRRKQEVIKYQSMEHPEWVKTTGYGYRWVITEGHFSGCKRIFGECVRATKKKNMYNEVKLKFWAYNKLLEI